MGESIDSTFLAGKAIRFSDEARANRSCLNGLNKPSQLKATEAGEYRDQSRDKLVAGLTALIDAMNSKGPVFSGDEINAVDIALIPFAYRIDVLLCAYRDFELPQTSETWQRYQRWYEAMLEHAAFRKTAFDQGDYEKRLVEHY